MDPIRVDVELGWLRLLRLERRSGMQVTAPRAGAIRKAY